MLHRRIVVAAFAASSIVVPLATRGSAVDPVAPTFHGLTPARLLDTRPGESTVDGFFLGGGSVGPAGTVDVAVLGRGGVPVTGVGSVALNITVVDPTAAGYVTAYATGVDRPTASNLNFVPGLVVANMAIVAVGDGGQIRLFNANGSTQIVVDVMGWFPNGAAYTGLRPARLLETRAGQPTVDGLMQTGAPVAGGTTIDVPILGRGGVPGSGVGSVALNVTVAGATAAGFVTVYPTGNGLPTASNLNFVTGQIVPNMVIVPIGIDGRVTLYNNAGNTDLIVDVLGWFPAGEAYTGLTPARLLDTRGGQPTVDGLSAGAGAVGPAAQVDVTVVGRGGVPGSGVGAVAVNVTATDPTANTYITVFPAGGARPTASNLNLVPGATVPNMAIIKVGTGGMISLYNNGGNTDLIVDVLGWFPLDTDVGGTTTTTQAPTTTTSPIVPGPTDLVSVASSAPPGNGDSVNPAVSGDGRYVAFASDASNLVAGDTLGHKDVFVRDRQAGTTKRVSIASGVNGAQANGNSDSPGISADGRFVVFRSFATNLVVPATDGNGDIFVRDTTNNVTFELSVTVDSTTDGNGVSSQPAISADGGYVVFRSTANNLGLGSTVGHSDIYEVKFSTSDGVGSGKWLTAPLVPGSTGDAAAPTVSADGSVVAFQTAASNLEANDGNGKIDVYMVGYQGGPMTRASRRGFDGSAPNGDSTNPSISGGGRIVAYQSDATNILPTQDLNLTFSDIYIFDAATQVTQYESFGFDGDPTNGNSMSPAIARDGSAIAFASDATNLIQTDTNTKRDIFIVNISTLGDMVRGSVATGGVQAEGGASHNPSLSGNGRYLVFDSTATNLGPDANATADVFIRDNGA